MKKAKIMLLAIVITAAAGGIVAFKVQSRDILVAYYQFNQDPNHHRCDVFLGLYSPTIGSDPVTTILSNVTTVYGALTCNLTTTVVPEDDWWLQR